MAWPPSSSSLLDSSTCSSTNRMNDARRPSENSIYDPVSHVCLCGSHPKPDVVAKVPSAVQRGASYRLIEPADSFSTASEESGFLAIIWEGTDTAARFRKERNNQTSGQPCHNYSVRSWSRRRKSYNRRFVFPQGPPHLAKCQGDSSIIGIAVALHTDRTVHAHQRRKVHRCAQMCYDCRLPTGRRT